MGKQEQQSAGIRETLGNSRMIGVVAVLVALVAGWWAMTSMSKPGQMLTFTTDDGKSTFEESNVMVPPFSRKGAEAVQAVMVSCDGGKTMIVGYLAKYDPDARRTVESMIKNNRGGMMPLPEIKKPGDSNWVKPADRTAVRDAKSAMGVNEQESRYDQARKTQCPDGSIALTYE